MADLPTRARVVIIGGGAVGASCLYHLAKAGWRDCVLLEKNELTSGSTWHAAGNVPTFSASWSIMNMQRYSTELYRDLGALVDYPMNYHVTGSLRLGHSSERMAEFERARSMGIYQGMDLEILSVSDLKDYYPFLETHDLEGALYDPCDGDIDPAQLTQALAKGARDLGAQIKRFCAVTGARFEGDSWVLETDQGTITTDIVVNAAGYRAQEVGRLFGREVPMMTMSHQYLITEEISELETWSAQHKRKLPLLRDVDSSYYLRQEKHGLNLGPYERNCRGHWMGEDDPMPDDFSFQLYPDDLDRLEWYIEDAMARVPLLGSVGVNKVINGPIPYTPDGNPLIGPMPGVKNAFEACVFTFGIAQAGGAGKVLAEWVTEGATQWDMWSCDPRRFTGFCDQDYCNVKGMEVYGHEYAMHFPHHEWPAGRNKRLSPVHESVVAQGGQMGAYNGWERANWFAKPGDDVSEESTYTWRREGPWFKRIKEESLAVRDHVGILDLPGFSRYRVSGGDARKWLDPLITGNIPKPGRIGLGYFADENGRLVTEMSIMCINDELFFLITAAAAEWHDLAWLERHLRSELDVTLTNVSDQFGCQIVSGPNSRALFADVCDADLSLPWLTHQTTQIAGKYCQLVRVSFAGELGWEIHSQMGDTREIFDAVMSAGASHGLKPFGMYALDSMRIEKAYKAWKGDLSTDYSVLELGLERFVNWNKPTFIGKSALQAHKAAGTIKQFVTMVVEGNDYDAPYMSTVWCGNEIVGEVTSGGWGHRVEKSIALGLIKQPFGDGNQGLSIDIFGKQYPATLVREGAIWDPQNLRLRA